MSINKDEMKNNKKIAVDYIINKLNIIQPLCSDIASVSSYFLEYICSFEKGLSYSKKGWVRLMNILYETYPKKMEEYF